MQLAAEASDCLEGRDQSWRARLVRVEQAQNILMGVLAGHSGCYLDSVTSLTSRVNQSGFGGRALEATPHSGPDRSFRGGAFVKRLEDSLSRPPEASPETLRGER
jgi:hypothetical protein